MKHRDLTNLQYDESECDINYIKYRSSEFDPEFLARVNRWLAASKNYGYKNLIGHDMIDRLLMIQQDKGTDFAIKYFRWRNENSLTKEELFRIGKNMDDQEAKKDDHADLTEQIRQLTEQIGDMQLLLINIAGSVNDELKQRRKAV